MPKQIFWECYWIPQKAVHKHFSYRYMGQKVGLDHSVIVKVMQAKRHLSREQILPFVQLLKLDKQEAEYLLALVDYGRATDAAELKITFEKLLSLRPTEQSSILMEHYQYFQKWYYVALRSLLDYYPFYGDNYEALGQQLRPIISGNEAKTGVKLLLDLGMLKINDEGRYIPTEAHLSTGERWLTPAIQQFQKETILLSSQALENIAREWRDISTLTLSLDSSALEEVRQVLKECRQSIVGIVDRMPSGKTDAVYQLNMQFIPLTKIAPPNKGK